MLFGRCVVRKLFFISPYLLWNLLAHGSFQIYFTVRSVQMVFLFTIVNMDVNAGGLVKSGEATNAYVRGSNHVYTILVGLFSAITGGISYCLIRSGAKASDQPM